MDIYKVLLVDDEEEVRQAIVRKLDWAALGFEMVGEAGNGEEALEMAERLAPDVIMTDIKMPFMDGLELCKRAKEILPGVRVAIFSGFDEFEYAKEAITQQVEEYILKPIDARELTQVFGRIHRALDEEIAQRRDMARLRRHYEESLPLLRQRMLFELLEGRSAIIQDYGLNLKADVYCVAVAEVKHTGGNGESASLLSISLQQLIQDVLKDAVRYESVQVPNGVTLLCMLDAAATVRTVTSQLDRLFSFARRLLDIQISIGIGSLCHKPEDISTSYEEATRALEYQILVEPGQCIYIGNMEPGTTCETMLDEKYIEEILKQIKIGREQELDEAVSSLVQYLKSHKTGIHHYQIYLLEFSAELLRLIRSYQLDDEEAQSDALLLHGQLYQFSNLGEMGSWLFSFCNNLRLLVRRERKDSARALVDGAKNLIQQQFSDSSLSLDSVCKELNVSTAYFSSLFKKETGEGFVGYLTALRMNKALELLTTTDDKTYQIAEKIGYTDANYFGYVFKKQFGVSPSKYRTGRLNGHVETAKSPG